MSGSASLAVIAWRHLIGAAVAVVVVLTLSSAGYGYHRDELYFRMLPADVGYVDQPPLTPWLARTLSTLVADEAWALRIPASLAAAAAVLLLGLLTRELGGGRPAQAIAVWGYAGTASVLMFGHVLLPATLDLALWLAILLAACRAALRDPRWWLPAGALIGLTTSNRWLVAVLAVSIALGVVALGPRSALHSPWLRAGVLAAAVLAAPHLVYQAAHGWPQLQMGAALAENNAADVRVTMWVLLFLLLGPPLVPIWVAGIGHLWRSPELRAVRFLLVALAALLAFTFIGATQPHYFMTPLAAVYAAGCVPLGRRVEQGTARAHRIGAFLALNAAVAMLIALPVLPEPVLGRTPVPSISPLVADQVGWPAYVATVATAYQQARVEHGEPVDIITSNYGEAGALARYGPGHGLPAPHSGHNHLHGLSRPTAETVLVVGGQASWAPEHFDTCQTVALLDNGVAVDNEQQGMPVLVCHGPAEPWNRLWPRFAHLD